MLAKFKKSLVEYSGKDTSKLDVRIQDMLENRKKVLKENEIEEEKNRAVADALAKAKAEGEMGLMSRFFG